VYAMRRDSQNCLWNCSQIRELLDPSGALGNGMLSIHGKSQVNEVKEGIGKNGKELVLYVRGRGFRTVS